MSTKVKQWIGFFFSHERESFRLTQPLQTRISEELAKDRDVLLFSVPEGHVSELVKEIQAVIEKYEKSAA